MRIELLLGLAIMAAPRALAAQAFSQSGPIESAVVETMAVSDLLIRGAPRLFVESSQRRPTNLPTQEDYGSGSSGLAYGAAIGGVVGVLAVALHTVEDNDKEPLSFFAAIGIPIATGVVGAVIGKLVSP